MTFDEMVAESTRRLKEVVWREGFEAGRQYGIAYERYSPDRDPGWDEPTEPRNPYAKVQPL